SRVPQATESPRRLLLHPEPPQGDASLRAHEARGPTHRLGGNAAYAGQRLRHQADLLLAGRARTVGAKPLRRVLHGAVDRAAAAEPPHEGESRVVGAELLAAAHAPARSPRPAARMGVIGV